MMGSRGYLEAQIRGVLAFVHVGGIIVYFCQVSAEVIQAGPAAAMRFTMAIDAGLWLLHTTTQVQTQSHRSGAQVNQPFRRGWRQVQGNNIFITQQTLYRGFRR